MLVFYQNVNRIRSKINDVFLNALNSNYDIICLTETNFNSSIYDAELFDPRYNIYRRDRSSTDVSKTEGGGIVLAIKKSIHAIRQTSWDSTVEDLWLTLPPCGKNKKTINFCLCYLPSHLPKVQLESFYDNCYKIILRSDDAEEFVCIGDYNTPGLSWSKELNSIALKASPAHDTKSHLLLDTMSICHLSQYNSIPNAYNRILDLVLATFDVQVYGAEALSRQDRFHPAIVLDIEDYGSSTKTLKPKAHKNYNFNKCKYSEVCDELSKVEWHSILSSSDIDLDLAEFYTLLNDIISKYTPLSKRYDDKYPAWFSPALKRCIQMKHKYHKLFKRYGNALDYDRFSHYRTKSKLLIDTCYKNYISLIEVSLDNNIKAFWKFVNSKKSVNSIPITMQYDGVTASDPSDVCELFSNYFSSVYENIDIVPESDASSQFVNHNSTLSGIRITKDKILGKIKGLDINKGPGPDNIPVKFIKSCANELCLPLQILFTKSLQSGKFPAAWKTAHVIPIFKSGDKTKCENYRPISILSCLAKLFESVVYDVLYSHVRTMLHPQQHGFVAHRSTTSNLLEYKNYLCSAFDERVQVDSIYTDFAKAFDKVNHIRLCRKLEGFGIHGSLLRWIQSYLNRRSQLVAVKGHLSQPVTVTSGVPQGSHLGPLLFIIFINDLIESLSCPCLLYADDLKVFKTVKNFSDASMLQNDLNALSTWCDQNFMRLNVSKCFVITFTRKINKVTFEYSLNNEVLERKHVAKDLGVLFDDQLTFHNHYDYIIKRSSNLLGFVSRSTKDFRNTNSFIHLYYTLIRSVLEYNSVIWSPFYQVHTDRIEKIQQRCLRILSYRCGMGRRLSSYPERLKHFRVIRLSERRKYIEATLLHKIIHSSIDSPHLLSLINFNTRPKSRNSNKLFRTQVFNNNTSYYNPVVRMSRQFNDILDSADNKDIDIFNHKLHQFQKHLKSILFH